MTNDPFSKLLPKSSSATTAKAQAKETINSLTDSLFPKAKVIRPEDSPGLTGKTAHTMVVDDPTAEGTVEIVAEPKPKVNRKRRRLHAGDVFGELTIIQKLRTNRNVPNIRREKYLCKCSCGNRLTVPKYYLMRKPNPKTHCGCLDQTSAKTTEKFTFNSWYMMNYRCYKPDHVAFKHYGGRGIGVDKRWHWRNPDGFTNFLEDMGRRPKDRSLDRINNNRGYSKDNCRWATSAEQRANQGHTDVEFEEDIIKYMVEDNKDADVLDVYDLPEELADAEDDE